MSLSPNNTEVSSALSAEVSAVETIAFTPYDAKIPPTASEGKRIAKVLYKAPKVGEKAAGENSYLELAMISPEALKQPEMLASFAPHFISYIESIQDVMVRKLHKNGVSRMSVSSFNLDAILEHLEEEGTSGRLSKEVIESWFVSEVEESLFSAFADKLGVVGDNVSEEQAEKLLLVCSAYKKKFVSVSSGRSRIPDSEIESLEKALQISGAKDSIVGARIVARLAKMKNATDDDLLLAL